MSELSEIAGVHQGFDPEVGHATVTQPERDELPQLRKCRDRLAAVVADWVVVQVEVANTAQVREETMALTPCQVSPL
jgi:hypothetical protein